MRLLPSLGKALHVTARCVVFIEQFTKAIAGGTITYGKVPQPFRSVIDKQLASRTAKVRTA